jgi:prepilin-type N-terminal cleavage/methylation domain-containing protein
MKNKDHGSTRRLNEKGFTLIEVIVAIGLLAFGILAVGTMQAASLGGTTTANVATEATTLAMDQLENLIGLQYTDARLNVGNYGPFTPKGNYQVRYAVVDNGNNTLTITVTVTYQGRALSTRMTQLTCIKNQL